MIVQCGATDRAFDYICTFVFFDGNRQLSLRSPQIHRLVEFADRSSMEYAMDELDNTKVINMFC